MKLNGVAVAAVGVGSLFVYSGIRGYSVAKGLQSVIQGNSPKTGGQANPITTPDVGAAADSSSAVSAAPTSVSGNAALARSMAAQKGWTGSQWNALYALWTRESGFRTTATNPTSGAYGIPQSLPASKMAAAGSDWKTNPATQIKWGLGYIEATYGTPEAAEAHEQAHGWY